MLVTRGHCLEDNQNFAAATASFHWAHQLTQDEAYFALAAKMWHLFKEQQKRQQEALCDLQEQIWLRQQAERLNRPAHSPGAFPAIPGFHSPADYRDVGHGSICQCFHCRQQRPQALAQRNGDFGHGQTAHAGTVRRIVRSR